MTFHFLLVINKQGKPRLTKWYSSYTPKEKEHIIRELAHLVTMRESGLCNFVDWREKTVIYKQYASLFFITCVEKENNELLTLEIIHRFVFILDKYFGSVTEVDLVYDFTRAYLLLDELIAAGELQETSAPDVLRSVDLQDTLHKQELTEKEKGKSGLKAALDPSSMFFDRDRDRERD